MFISHRPPTTAAELSPLSRKTQPVPIAVISIPAIAGPTMRARLNVIEFSATALVSWPGPTISTTNDWRTGASTAEKQPSTKHSA